MLWYTRKYIQVNFNLMDQIIIFCASYLIYISIFAAAFHIFFKHEKKHHIRHSVIIFGTAFFAWVVAHVLKGQIMHERPDLALALIVPDDRYSFPSGHATFMFALAFSMLGFDKKIAFFIGILGILTGIARVLAGVHYWYDIVGGFVLGAGVASLTVMIAKKYIRK